MIIKVTYNVTDVYMSTSVSPIYIKVSYDGGGGITEVAWGDITGTLSDQTDLQSALDLKVPYSGATTNVNLGEYEIKAGQLTLDTTPTGTAAVGTTRWNDTIGSSETTLKGGNVILKNGVDLVARVVNKVTPNTTLTKAAYQAVRISGAQGQRLAVELAQANNDNNSADTIGLVTETIATNQEGFIMTVGSLEGINTTGSLQGETWADGDVLYLSPTTAGRVTNVKPVAPQHLVVIGYVEYAHANNGKIYVKVMNGWELGELHDVNTSGATNGQVLAYNSTSGIWEPTTNGSGTVTSVAVSAGTGISVSGSPITSSGTITVTNSAPDQVVGLTGAGTTTTSGTYPNFTITSNDQYTGTVTSVGLTSSTSGVTITGSPVTSSGSLNFEIATASGSATGLLSSTDWTTFNNKQNALTNPITGTGTSGQVAYWSGTNTQTGSSTFLFTPTSELDLANSVTASSAIARGSRIRPTLVAAANNDVLVGLDVNPTFTNGAFTGVSNLAARFIGNYVLYQNSAGNPGTGYAMEFATNSNLPRVDFVVNGVYVGQFSSNTSDVRFANNLNTTGGIIFNTKSGGTNTDKAKIFNNGNLLLQNGGTFTDSGQRLQVNGDTFIKGSGNTSGTNALLVQNSASTNLLTINNAGTATFVGSIVCNIVRGNTGQSLTLEPGASSQRIIVKTFGSVGGSFNLNNPDGAFTSISGAIRSLLADQGFAPTSGTATMTYLDVVPTINQTGGANGITRGLYVNPTLTAAADWRAIEAVSVSNANHTLIKLRNATVDVFTVKADSKIGFFNATPVAQATTGIGEATFVENSGGTAVNVDSTFAGYTLQQIAQALKDFGLLA